MALMVPNNVVVTEWRVTGQPNSVYGVDFPPYNFTWRETTLYAVFVNGVKIKLPAKEAVMHFINTIANSPSGPWTDGPYLTKRTVTYSPWETIDITTEEKK